MKVLEPKRHICVSVCEKSARALSQSIERAARLGDMVELRLDCLAGAELDEALANLETLLDSQTTAFILTLRPLEQGGRREIDSLNRIVFWLNNLGNSWAGAQFADIEFDVVRVLMEKQGLDWNRVICSHHDFSGAQFNLEQLYREMKETPARILKIAVRAHDVTDCIPVFQLLERAREEGRALIALAMGEAGIMTRILGPSRGSFLTYGSLEASHATAPGQSTAEELRALYRVHKITEATTVMGLISGAVAHSISRHIHNAAFEESGEDAVYIPFKVRDVAGFLRRMAHPRSRELEWKLRGLSVTAPHKTAVVEHLDWIEPAAKEMEAVNTIVIEGEELRGYNTDAAAFLSPLVKRVGELSGKEIAIIGAGGAARSALWSLSQAGARVTLFARDIKKAEPLAEKFNVSVLKLEGALFADFDIVVNATPLGTRGASEAETSATTQQLRGVSLAYDLVYNPQRTRFLLEAQKAGCRILSGLEMLIAQAAEQFRLWTGREAPVAVMMDAASRALETKV